MAAPAISSQALLTLMKNRRTYYALSKSSPIPNDKITAIVQDVLKHSPSSFNSQSTRVVVLFGGEHDKLWGFAKEAIKAIVPADAWPASEQRLNGFLGGYGTVLFFDDRTTVAGMQQKFALYADKFPVWASQSNGMTQYAVWTALEAEGLGANLQHYNPLIDQKVAEEWGLSKDWELSAQLVFGKREGEPGEKTFMPIEERVKVFGA
ncbi:Nitroreductase [Mollisia scopiformis]|uniref:Nitroreductase n=1 Tax=Mollisia scopiformis TaxID=149040 RepID=A0A132B4K1_MOLSC|nr:Nitroreductase [Mollisia scopiformis]KUJ07173.1 Nitroreductase [Mollisia scopiformis]